MHLTDCFIETVAYVAYFLKSVDSKQPPFEQVKADILRLLAKSEQCVKKGLFAQNDFDQARFIICAWVDEAILNSSWKHKGQWQGEQLQRLYYQTADAGEEAFDRLNALGLHQRDVREVYYLCLVMGFAGRYCHKGDEYLLDQLKTSNLKLLMGSSVGIPSIGQTDLFPEAYPVKSFEVSPQKRRFSFSLLTIIGIGGPVLLFLVLFLIYKFALNGVGENFLKAVL